ncbi:putative tubulin polyglutamylase TTLL2 [Tenrec ecaudatus]|uniref:putative tubulin polyglutamylase TTLL2 n=1 Tax=Tenrec ecaudatus TaxID=94439 RepID=UPI003F5AB114
MGTKRKPAGLREDDETPKAPPKPVFRVDDTTPEVVQSVLLERGWSRFDGRSQDGDDWDLYWRTPPFPVTKHVSLQPWQQLNHHPGTSRLTRKDDLAKLLRHMQGAHGAGLYAFIPLTFILPSEYHKFVAEYSREMLRTKPGYWICKPAELSRGRGISIFRDIRDLAFDDTCVVQKYICNPLLVGHYKCDLRIYVCVTAFQPLTAYIYQEGLVRFATEKFDLRNLQSDYAHLTNSSINRSGPSYGACKDVIGRGCKWLLSRLFSYLRLRGVDDGLLWRQICRLAILTLLAAAPGIPTAANCFELLGFDVLVDDSFKPWLLEVNYSPALTLHCSTDVSLKRALIHDVIELVHGAGAHVWGWADDRASSASDQGHRDRPSKGSSPLPCWPHLQVVGRALSQGEPFAIRGKTGDTGPQTTQDCVPRESMPEQDKLPTWREVPRAKARVRSRLTQRKSSTLQSHSCRPASSPVSPSNTGSECPKPQVGNFILIFPFNEATLQASRKRLNVKGIVHELQKFMAKQECLMAESGTDTK